MSCSVMGVAWSPEKDRLATVGADKALFVWNARNGELLLR
jgi:WD40 repeat protein